MPSFSLPMVDGRQWRESEQRKFIWSTQFRGCILLPGRQCQDKVLVGAQWILSCYPKLLMKSRYRNRSYWAFLHHMRPKGKIPEPTWLWVKVYLAFIMSSLEKIFKNRGHCRNIVREILLSNCSKASFCRAKPDFLQQKTVAKTTPPFPHYLS